MSRRDDLHYSLEIMTNTELTLDQLKTINGGAAFMKLGDIKGEATDQKRSDWIIIESYNPGKGASVNGTIGYE